MDNILQTNTKPAHKFWLATWITQVIDWFYPPFHKMIPHQTFRYIACGGGNQLLNLIIYHICVNYIFKKQVWEFGFFAFKPHIAAFLVAFCITFPIGFLLAKYVIFHASPLRGRTQARRYFGIVIVCIILNYFILKLFVEYFHWNETLSMALNILLVTFFSYLTQKRFAFKSVG